MGKHGQHVKDPTFKKRFRVKPQFDVDPATGFTKNLYRVEQYIKGEWLAIPELEPYETRQAAHAEAERRGAPWAS